MEVPVDTTAKPLDERSLVLQKQKDTSAFLRELTERGENTHQVQLPEETNWKVQEQDVEEDLSQSGLYLDTALTVYR